MTCVTRYLLTICKGKNNGVEELHCAKKDLVYVSGLGPSEATVLGQA